MGGDRCQQPVNMTRQQEQDPLSRRQRTFQHLPEEIKLLIFSYLPHDDKVWGVSLVCREWNRLIWDESVWKQLLLCASMITLEMATTLVERMPQLKRVKIYRTASDAELSFYPVDDIVHVISKNCPQLEVLILKRVEIGQMETFPNLVRMCKHMREVSLYEVGLSQDAGRNLVDDFASCIDLQALYLFESYVPQGTTDTSVPLYYPSLKEVDLRGSVSESLIQALISRVGGQLRKLKVSSLSALHLPCLRQCDRLDVLWLDKGYEIDDLHLLSIIGGFDKLQGLAIRGAPNLTTIALLEFFSRPRILAGLEHLYLGHVPQLNDLCLGAIAMNCPALTHIQVDRYKVTLYGLKILAARCTHLKKLWVTYPEKQPMWSQLAQSDIDQLISLRPGLHIEHH